MWKRLFGAAALSISLAAPANTQLLAEDTANHGTTAAHTSLEAVLDEKPVALFENLELSGSLDAMVSFYTRVYTETDNVIFYNNKTYELYKETEHAGPFIKSDVMAARKELSSLTRDLVKNKLAKRQDVSFVLGKHSKVEENFERLSPWTKHIIRELSQNGVSQNIIALPVLESTLNPNAISRVGAVGISQFMKNTGLHFLMINGAVDERLDPVYEMRATARLLNANYARYGRAPQAIGAYHTGIGNYDRATAWAMAVLEEPDEEDLFSTMILDFTRQKNLRGSFKEESKKYVPIYKGVEVGLEKQFAHCLLSPGIEFDAVKFQYTGKAKIKIDDLAKSMGISKENLKELNPALLYLRTSDPALRGFFRRHGRVSQEIPEGYELRLPLGKAADFTNQYSDRMIIVMNESHKNSNIFDSTVYNTPADLMYAKIIERRRNGDLAGIARSDLEDVKLEYERIRHENNQNYSLVKWVENKISVVNYDLYLYDFERKENRRGLSYISLLEAFSQKVMRNSEKYRVQ